MKSKADRTIRFGWATVDITPKKTIKLRGQFHERISTHVRDPLTATALAMEDGSDQVVMVSCDLCSVDRELQERLRGSLRTVLPELKGEKLFLSATHIHTGPYTNSEQEQTLLPIVGGKLPFELPQSAAGESSVMNPSVYADFLVERLKEAAVQAWTKRRPGRVSWALSHAVVGHNRRTVYCDGAARMYGGTDTDQFETLEGPSDHGVELLYGWDANATLTGIVINVACPSQVVEGQCFVSADFWDEVRKRLTKRFGPEVAILPLCGAAGDQSPRDLPRRGRGEPSMSNEEGLREVGERIADAVEKKFETARQRIVTDAVLRHAVREIQLPLRRVTETEAAQARKDYDAILAQWKAEKKPVDAGLFVRLFEPSGILRRWEEQQQNASFSVELHAVRIGEVAVATNPFELFIDYGLQMKARSPAQQTFLAQLACDCGGYLPTARAVRGGHYSAVVASGKVGPEGGKLLVNQTVQMINALWK